MMEPIIVLRPDKEIMNFLESKAGELAVTVNDLSTAIFEERIRRLMEKEK